MTSQNIARQIFKPKYSKLFPYNKPLVPGPSDREDTGAQTLLFKIKIKYMFLFFSLF